MTSGAAGSSQSNPPGSRRTAAFQGAPGAFSEEALFAYLGPDADSLPCRSFADVVDAVAGGRAEYGVLPVENTLAGTVAAAYDALADSGLQVTGEIIHPIRHCLLGLPGARSSELVRIVSHPVALAQCTRFLGGHPSAESVAVYDTAGGAREVAEEGDVRVGAVASRGAAARYGLAILAVDVQDRADNQTRFYVVRREAAPERGKATGAGAPGRGAEAHETAAAPDGAEPRSVLLLEVDDRPGALLSVLEPFARRGINLTKLESRPAEVPWRYRFLLELAVDARAEPGTAAIGEVDRTASSLRVLGSFPAAPRG